MMLRQVVTLLVVLLLPGLSHSFNPNYGTSVTHRSITETAILRKILEVCQDLGIATRGDFTLTIDDNLSVNAVLRACSSDPSSTSPLSSDDFQTAIKTIHRHNTKVDIHYASTAARHFDNEAFQEGRNIITKGLVNVKTNAIIGNFWTGRKILGEICHTLQDFYSHSNWVELGKTTPYSTLIKQDQPLENLAGVNVPTCRSCTGDNCQNNILPEVITQQLITSGYFESPSNDKPAGKCSHGGYSDQTSFKDPVGGINKDTQDSSHGFLYQEAADLALDATLELLEDIRVAVGDRNFLRFMGVSQSSALCFVIDTTGSMRDDIAAVRDVTFRIIDSRTGTPEEPSLYILVPFHDPKFGPASSTTDPDVFKASINRLTASGGAGDIREKSLSGLHLALATAPPASDIFLFTDASANDAHLKNTVTALIESTKSVVTFMLSDVLATRRGQSDGQNPLTRSMTQAETEIYRDLARASGGQTIEVSKLDLTQATAVIEDLTANAVVTVFQAAVDPGRPMNFSFVIDASVRNIIIYITGVQRSLTFRLTSSTGVSQDSSQPSGPLATFSTVGNLRRISLNSTTDTGMWEISVNSRSPYIVKITGQSSVNFVYDIVEEREGAHGGLDSLDGRPPGGNVTLLVTVTGSDTATITHMTLFDSSSMSEIHGSVQRVSVLSSAVLMTSWVVVCQSEQSEAADFRSKGLKPPALRSRFQTFLNLTAGRPFDLFPVASSPYSKPLGMQLSSIQGLVANGNTGSTTDILAHDIGLFKAEGEAKLRHQRAGTNKAVDETLGRFLSVGNKISIISEEHLPDENAPHLGLCSEACQSLGGNDYLVRFREVPAKEFVVRLRGEDSSSTSKTTSDRFLRQASTQLKTSSISVTAQANSSSIEPGSSLAIPFTVSSSISGKFPLQVSNDRSYATTAPNSVTIALGSGGEANGMVTLTVPASAKSGTDVTVTIEVENAAATEMNFAVLRFSVVTPVTDISSPVCQIVNITGICPASSSLCATTQWEFIAKLTDGINGTGIVTVSLRQGNGILNTSMEVGPGGENITVVTYSSSCCSQSVEVAAVDGVGNVGRCVGQAMAMTTPAPTATTASTTPALTASVGWLMLIILCSLLFIILVAFLCKSFKNMFCRQYDEKRVLKD
ncbi:von Willebrand factor A domain-containing protein 7-like [Salarias fasciatus]|uniref:von Willebrand factor A domain-containing protein 7-like n=1 Tax=Salarias fasciatus TaxID=181472 RepID=UPI0011768367|nr:von Willebrand factor A domain-containing protein 7-like [Salarias fasciatus]